MTKKETKHCGICGVPYFERNNYYYGKLMTVRDFFAEQCYFNEKRWLINRMILGWGVVCGLDVKLKEGATDQLVITPGLAVDCCGREILVCEDQEVGLIPEELECHKEKPKAEAGEKKLFICLEWHECKTEPVSLPPIACDQKEKGECNRIRDSFKIRVKDASEVDIEPPYGKYCPLEDKGKNIHWFLCEKLRAGCPECPERPCLILAEVTITPSLEPNILPAITINQCSKRKLVYTNPLLYDLINCFHGDLPHVIEINWKENGAILSWDEFTGSDGIYEKGVQVKFDKKMNPATIITNTFLFVVKMEDSETGNIKYEQVPGTVEYSETESTAIFKIESAWLKDVYFGYSAIREKGGEFMVTLRGDFILSVDEDGRPAKALDGNFIGGQLPSGNGTQGGDFISWFFVEPKPELLGAKAKRR